MARYGPRAPASGFGARRGAAGLAIAIMLGSAGPATAQRLAYPAVAPSEILMLGGQPHRFPGPRLAYPLLPADARIAPDDFLLDSDEDEPASPAEQARAADALALAQLSQNYRPRPALWRITRGPATIYLFGTIHILPPGFAWRSAAVDRAVAESATLIVEAVDDGAPVTTQAARPAPLATRVSPDHRATLARFLDTLPPHAAAQLDAMPTWMVAVAVGYVRDIQAGETPGPGADDWLEARFRTTGRPVVPIENGARVMARVGAIPEDAQRRLLDAALDAREPPRAVLRAPTHAWAKGEVGPGSPLTIDLGRGSGADALNGALLVERNRAWAATLAQRLKTPGTAFFAAGAGHFIGTGSVLELLKKRGIRVERID